MAKDLGSYTFGTFTNNDQELTRLQNQATLISEKEQAMLLQAGLTTGMQVLDIGCGPGCVTCDIAALIGEGQVTGVDANPLLLDFAKDNLSEIGLTNVTFVQGDVYTLDLPNDTYDFVYARLLFQHLREPHKALQSIRQVLKPDGILCILDVDDAWLTVFPEPEAFQSFVTRAQSGQHQKGGDRCVGRKLGSYLLQSGFREVTVNILPITSQEVGLSTFLDITTSFKREQIPAGEKAMAEQELQNIYTLLDIPEAMGFIGVFTATGRK